METITLNFETITALTIAASLFICGIAFLIINNKHI